LKGGDAVKIFRKGGDGNQGGIFFKEKPYSHGVIKINP